MKNPKKKPEKKFRATDNGGTAYEADEFVSQPLKHDHIFISIKNFLNKGKVYPFFLTLIMAAAIWFSYHHCLNARFQLDDGLRIAQNSHVHMRDFSWDHLFSIGHEQHDKRRWFTVMTLKLNYYFFWLNPYGYRLTNVVIHMAAAVLLFLVLIPTFRRSRPDLSRDDSDTRLFLITTAFAAAMAWALSPLSTAAVTYVIQRSVSMSSMLCLAVLGCYLLGRQRKGLLRWVFYGLGIVLWVPALGSKEPAALLPLGILLYELYFFRDLRWTADDRKQRMVVIFLFILAVVGMVILVWGWEYLLKKAGLNYDRYDYNHLQRLLSFPRILFYYLSLIFWPLPGRIAVDPSFVPHSVNLFVPWTTLPAWAGLGALVYGAWFLRRREKLISFGICWLLLNLVIEQLLIPLQLVFHHRLYLPSMFILAGLLFFLARQARALDLTGPGLVAVTCAISMLGFGTYLRNDVWNSPIKIWGSEFKLDPDSPRIKINLAREYINQGQPWQAISLLYRAIDEEPGNFAAYLNIADAFLKQGQPDQALYFLNQGVAARRHWPPAEAFAHTLTMAECYMAKNEYDQAEQFLLKALKIAPMQNLGGIHMQLAALYAQQEHYELAIAAVEDAVAAQDKFYAAYLFLGSLYALQNNYDAAGNAFEKALGGDDATNANALRHLASLAERKNNMSKALELYRESLKFEPDSAAAHLNVATILSLNQDLEKAAEHYRQVLNTGDLRYMHMAYFNLGKMAIDQQDWNSALHYLERAYNLKKDYVPVLYALGNLYLDNGFQQQGQELLTIMLKLEPNHPQAKAVAERLTWAGDQTQKKEQALE